MLTLERESYALSCISFLPSMETIQLIINGCCCSSSYCFCTFSLSSLEKKIKGCERANQYYLGVRRKNGKIGQKVSKKERKKRHVRRRLLDSISDRTSGRNERIFSLEEMKERQIAIPRLLFLSLVEVA